MSAYQARFSRAVVEQVVPASTMHHHAFREQGAVVKGGCWWSASLQAASWFEVEERIFVPSHPCFPEGDGAFEVVAQPIALCATPPSIKPGRTMVEGFLGTLTTEERTLLHLHNQTLPSGGWEAPATLTQAGISAAVHVQRKHIPRTLKRMEKNGHLEVAQRHIPGGKQRKRVYTLSEKGGEHADALRDRLFDELVTVNGDRVRIGELWVSPQPLLELLSHIDGGMVYHPDALISPVSNPEGMVSIDAQYGEELVRRMFARAWEDGKITKDEQSLLNEVVEFLGMHPERARRLSNEARKSLKIPPPEEVYYDMILQALDDGEIMQDEQDLLETFRVAFGIDQLAHNRLLEQARNQPVQSEHYDTYAATLKTALQDNVITADEHAMLRTLRLQLDITEDEHERIMNDITGKARR
jgi:DNA-binding MarR family transcriptional regulator